MCDTFTKNNIDLDKLYNNTKEELYQSRGGCRLNFGVYYTPKFLWAA